MAICQLFVIFVILIVSDLKLSDGRQLQSQTVNRSWKKNKIFEYHPVPHPFLPDEARHHQPRFRSRPTKFQNYRYPTRRTKYKSLPFEDDSRRRPPSGWGLGNKNSHWGSSVREPEFGHGHVDSHWASATTNNEFVISTTCNENEPCYSSKETSKEVVHVPDESDEMMIPGTDSEEDEIQDLSHKNKSGLKKLFHFAMPLLVGLCAWMATLMMMSSVMTPKTTTTTNFASSEEIMSNAPGIHLHMETDSEEVGVTELSLAEQIAQEEKEKDKQHDKLLKKLDVTDQVLSIVERGLLLAVRKVELLSVISGFGQQLGSNAGTGPGSPSALGGGLPGLLEGALSLLPNLTQSRNEALQEVLQLEANSTAAELPLTTEQPVSNSSSLEVSIEENPPASKESDIVVKPSVRRKPELTNTNSSSVETGYLKNPYILSSHIRTKRPNSYNRNKPYLYEYMESTTRPQQSLRNSTTSSAPPRRISTYIISKPTRKTPTATTNATASASASSKPKLPKYTRRPRPSTSEREAFDFAVPVQ